MFVPRVQQLAMGVRILFKYIAGLSEASADALSSWLSHHIANFENKWIWSEWYVPIACSHDAGSLR